MKIISKHRDYYDSIAFMYGGGDPKIRYERDVVPNAEVILAEHLAPEFPRYYIPNHISTRYLVICDKWLTLYWDMRSLSAPDWKLATREAIEEWEFPKWLRGSKYWTRFEEGLMQGNERLVNLSKAVGSPIYIIKDYARSQFRSNNVKFEIEERYTPLFEYGVQEYYPPEQIYQDLSYFVANVLNPSPDMQPAGKPPQTDKEKILAHGMDLKTSFRGK